MDYRILNVRIRDHGDFQGVPEALLLAAMGACSSLQIVTEDTLWETFV